MEHKVEQNLNKTSATDLGGSRLVSFMPRLTSGALSLIRSDLVSFLWSKSLRGEFPVCAANQYFDSKCFIISTFCGRFGFLCDECVY